MITLHPGYDLLHCHECALRWRMDETDVPVLRDMTGKPVRHCPLYAVCDFCDHVELECDLTGVMPRVGA